MTTCSLLREGFSAFILIIFLLSLCPAPAHAEPLAFGEIKASGKVYVGSPAGKWSTLPDIYPLLKNTRLRTGEGVAGIATKEGSRLDLSSNTEAEIGAAPGSYTVNLSEGTVAFNVIPDTAVRIITKELDITVARQVGGYFSLVAGPGTPSYNNVQGLVTRNDKGTLIRSMTGRIQVAGKKVQARIINPGESLFAAADESKSEAIAVIPQATDRSILLKQSIIVGAFFTSGTIVAVESFRGDGFKSPSGF